MNLVENGHIRLNKNVHWKGPQLYAAIAHELGHVAVFQHTSPEEYTQPKILQIEEGISMHFEKDLVRAVGVDSLWSDTIFIKKNCAATYVQKRVFCCSKTTTRDVDAHNR